MRNDNFNYNVHSALYTADKKGCSRDLRPFRDQFTQKRKYCRKELPLTYSFVQIHSNKSAQCSNIYLARDYLKKDGTCANILSIRCIVRIKYLSITRHVFNRVARRLFSLLFFSRLRIWFARRIFRVREPRDVRMTRNSWIYVRKFPMTISSRFCVISLSLIVVYM